MAPRRFPPLPAAVILAFLLSCAAAQGDDIRCLRGVKDALSDPAGSLLSWTFSNGTVGYVCSFTGVSCWNAQENRVLGLSLTSMSLHGSIPPALQYCRSVNSLDLSTNNLSGPIPPDLCSWLPYLVSLDLSNNQLSGPIPSDLSSCRFLNTLSLSNNRLSGSIPPSIGRLYRLHRLDLSRNRLSGPIPSPLAAQFDGSAFSNNAGLCGRPVSSRCGGDGGSLSRTSLIVIVASGILGAAVSLLLAHFVWNWCFRSRLRAQPLESGLENGLGWAKRLRSSQYRLVPVSLFQKPIVKVKLADLLAATSDFSQDHIVTAGSDRTGTSYKAVLPDGSALTVKRLRACPLNEKQFRAEMGRIGQLRHPNLVPLLGFCVVEDEHLLIYKHIPSGALNISIHSLDWSDRLRIGVRAARGLAWLHHGFQIPFIHQSLSSNAVLLDEDFEPRITDFGLGRLVQPTSSAFHCVNMNMSPFMNGDFGEFGYLAPEYATNPIASTKGDVYAFGVVLLELATGQKATEVATGAGGEMFKGNLVDWVNKLSGASRIHDAIDKSLRGRGNDNDIELFLTVACRCVLPRPKERPPMYQVYDSLKSIGEGNNSMEQFDEFPLLYGKNETETM